MPGKILMGWRPGKIVENITGKNPVEEVKRRVREVRTRVESRVREITRR